MVTRRRRLELQGFQFIWAESAYRVCVRYRGIFLGSFSTLRPYGIPSDEELGSLIRFFGSKK